MLRWLILHISLNRVTFSLLKAIKTILLLVILCLRGIILSTIYLLSLPILFLIFTTSSVANYNLSCLSLITRTLSGWPSRRPPMVFYRWIWRRWFILEFILVLSTVDCFRETLAETGAPLSVTSVLSKITDFVLLPNKVAVQTHFTYAYLWMLILHLITHLYILLR